MSSVFAQALAGTGVGGLVLLGVFILIQLFLNKKLRTPSDRLADAQFSVSIWKDQLAETKADRKLLEETVTTMRGYVDKLETDGRNDQETINGLYRQIRALEDRNAEKDEKIRILNRRIEIIADKVNRGEPITLFDLGHPETAADLEIAP